MSYQRMKEKAAQLAAEVADRPKQRMIRELPEELAFRERRLEKIREAMAALLPNRPRPN